MQAESKKIKGPKSVIFGSDVCMSILPFDPVRILHHVTFAWEKPIVISNFIQY